MFSQHELGFCGSRVSAAEWKGRGASVPLSGTELVGETTFPPEQKTFRREGIQGVTISFALHLKPSLDKGFLHLLGLLQWRSEIHNAWVNVPWPS